MASPVPCPDCGLLPFLYEDCRLEPKGFSIRLVRLHPARDINADIVVDLTQTNDPNVAFDALSWCWGPGLWTKSVRARTATGDRCLKVSENLELALRHLRYPDKFREMWIDFLSIDQSSPVEKSRQVPQMAKIYGQANSVCVWLGEPDEKSKRAMRFIREHLVNLQRFDQLCKAEEYQSDWLSLIEFFERSWFSRRWVIQEIALANHKTASVHCGDDCLTWSQFAEAVSLFESALDGPLDLKKLLANLQDNVTYRSRYDPALGARQLVKATNSLFRTSFYNGDPLPLKSLEELVSEFWMYETSQPRDVIYALLSISKDAFRLDAPHGPEEDEWAKEPKTAFDSLPTARRLILSWLNNPSIRQAFKVDYQASVIDVYRQFIAFSVSKADKSRALDIICRPWAPELNRSKHKTELPSWICTLANSAYKLEHQGSIGQRLARRNPDPLVGMPDQTIYSASGNVGPQHQLNIFKYWDKTGSSMYLRGFVLDEIGPICAYSQLGNIPIEWLKLANWDPREPGLPPESFWRTLVADRGPGGQKDPLAFYPRACEFVFRHAIDDTLDTSMLMEQGSSIIHDFVKRVQAVIWNRKLMRTHRGNRLGLVPKGARPGDLICILYGCSVPVVLRRHRKDRKDLEEELRDEKERMTNAASYIAKMWRANTRRRREYRERYQNMIRQHLEQTRIVSGMGDQFSQHHLQSLHHAGYGIRRSPNTLPPLGSFTNGTPDQAFLATPTRQFSYYNGTFISPRPALEHDFAYYYQNPPTEREIGTNDDVMYPESTGMIRTFSNDGLFYPLGRIVSGGNQSSTNDLSPAQPMVRSISGGGSSMVGVPVVSSSHTSLSTSNGATIASTSTDDRRNLPPLSVALSTEQPFPRTASPAPMHQTPPQMKKRRPTVEFHLDTTQPAVKRTSPGQPPKVNGGPVGGSANSGNAAEKQFYYKLVGECYIHGMMNGEAIAYRTHYNSRKSLDGKIMVETFELR